MTRPTNQAGKGSTRRPTDQPAYDRHYGLIKWAAKQHDKKCAHGKHCTCATVKGVK